LQDKNVRMRLLEVHKILMETKENNAITVKKIIERLNRSIQLSKPFTDRKAIYKDVEAMNYSILCRCGSVVKGDCAACPICDKPIHAE
jgi:hypothetical protein